MESLSYKWYALIFLLITAGYFLYYLAGRKRRKGIYYHKSHRDWHEHEPHGKQDLIYTVFLIGDAGAPSLTKPEPNFLLLQSQLLKAGKDSTIFFLGDNIYPHGMPKPTDPLHSIAERRLLGQLDMLKGFEGKFYFISGNHDWNKGNKGGLAAVLRQQAYLEAYYKRDDILIPRNGCPGPLEVNLSENITAVVINTQWWVHKEEAPLGQENGCVVDNDLEFFIMMDEILEKNKDKKIIVIGHHPMYSKSFHGGRFDMKHHLFPFTELNKNMYIPIPIAGSIYPMYRKYIGIREDVAHPRYRRMRKRLIRIFQKYKDLVYAAGHDHNLQYIKKHEQHYIVSGAGCKTTEVQRGRGAFFTHAHRGFFRLNYYNDGEVWIEAWEPKGEGVPGVLAYRKKL